MEYTRNRIWTLAALAAVAAVAALALGFPMTAAGVVAGLPVAIVNYLMMFSVRRQVSDGGKFEAGPMISRSMLRLLFAAGAIMLASLVSAEFMIGVLVGVITEVFSYFKDAMRMFFARKE